MSIEELTGKNGTRGTRKGSKGGKEVRAGTNESSKQETNQNEFYSSLTTSTGMSEASKSTSSQTSSKHTALIRGLLFIAGFSVVFVALGASITALGALFFDYGRWIEIIGGVLLVVFGLHLLGVLRIPGTEREWKFHFSKRPVAGHIGFLVIGMGFGVWLDSLYWTHIGKHSCNSELLAHHLQLELRYWQYILLGWPFLFIIFSNSG